MTVFQWVVIGWLTLLTIGFVILRLSLVRMLTDLLRLRIRIHRDSAQLVTHAITAHAQAPLRHAHPSEFS